MSPEGKILEILSLFRELSIEDKCRVLKLLESEYVSCTCPQTESIEKTQNASKSIKERKKNAKPKGGGKGKQAKLPEDELHCRQHSDNLQFMEEITGEVSEEGTALKCMKRVVKEEATTAGLTFESVIGHTMLERASKTLQSHDIFDGFPLLKYIMDEAKQSTQGSPGAYFVDKFGQQTDPLWFGSSLILYSIGSAKDFQYFIDERPGGVWKGRPGGSVTIGPDLLAWIKCDVLLLWGSKISKSSMAANNRAPSAISISHQTAEDNFETTELTKIGERMAKGGELKEKVLSSLAMHEYPLKILIRVHSNFPYLQRTHNVTPAYLNKVQRKPSFHHKQFYYLDKKGKLKLHSYLEVIVNMCDQQHVNTGFFDKHVSKLMEKVFFCYEDLNKAMRDKNR